MADWDIPNIDTLKCVLCNDDKDIVPTLVPKRKTWKTAQDVNSALMNHVMKKHKRQMNDIEHNQAAFNVTLSETISNEESATYRQDREYSAYCDSCNKFAANIRFPPKDMFTQEQRDAFRKVKYTCWDCLGTKIGE